jgi:hypothetical protein
MSRGANTHISPNNPTPPPNLRNVPSQRTIDYNFQYQVRKNLLKFNYSSGIGTRERDPLEKFSTVETAEIQM